MSESVEVLGRIGFVGSGAVAGALARALAAANLPVVAVSSRRLERAEKLAAALPNCRAFVDPQAVADASDTVVLAVPDEAIEPMCASLRWRRGQVVLHCSGAHSLDLLASAATAGCLVGSFHPLQTFAGQPEDAERIAGSVVGIEADESLRARLADLAETIGARPIFLTAESKVLYHVAAVLISNYSVTLASLAAELWESFGVPRADALRALLPLLTGAVGNLDSVGLPSALTGPIARGDVTTVASHLRALAASSPQLLPLYRELGYKTVDLARERGLDSRAADAIRSVLAGSQEDNAVRNQRN
ncbi:MAG TPA: DUF2520 domain-containing protein [Nitrolancea sp.]|nr:DUF2520 domain-containing protein [Nitrolancea sp.]